MTEGVWLSGLVLAISSLALFAFGLNMLFLSWRALRLPRPSSTPLANGREPAVCVQLPIYDERYVAERVIDAACSLDWPRARLEIQVLDDSDDDTTQIVARRVRHWRRRGLRVDHVRRGTRAGYKAGALAHGMELTAAPLLAVMDADFVPGPDFLRRSVAAFEDEKVGFAHARWGHLNERYSPLTFLQALAVDFHFLVEQAARCSSGYFTNFTGTAGIWRRRAIEESGGWSSATLTEDLDLSYRAQRLGWKAAYLEDVVVPEELPVGTDAYRRQQSRWATGSFQSAFLHLVPVLRSRLPAGVKWQAFVHLSSYLVGPLMLVQLLCYPGVLIAKTSHEPFFGLGTFGLAVNLISVAPWAGFAVAQHRRGRPWWTGLPACFCQMIGAGLSLTVVAAFVRALRPGGEFKRTPKYRIVEPGQEWRDGSYVFVGNPIALAELGLGAFAAGVAVAGSLAGVWLISLYAGLFAIGTLMLGGTSLLQTLQVVTLRRLGRTARRRLGSLAPLAGLLLLPALLLLGVAQLPDGFEDSYHHWLIAARLAETGSLRDPLFGMEDTWLPGYQLLAAGLLKLFGVWQLGVLKGASALLALATLAMVNALAPSRRAGRLAVLLCALNPIFWMTATSTVAEPLLTALLMGATAAAVAGRLRSAALLALLACLTGTKAWLWVIALVAVYLLERALAARRPSTRPAVRWALPALAALALLQLAFGPATHSVARAAVEVASATDRGSLAAGPGGRGFEFAGWFLAATLPLAVLAPLGFAAELRSEAGRRRLRFLHLPATVYLGAVLFLVWAGVYTGSHRYYYPALPALALLAGAAIERRPAPVAVLTAAAAALIAVAYVPVATSFATANGGLAAAGRASARVPGALLTDSPVAAFWSGKDPATIAGSRMLPLEPGAAVNWMRRRGITSLVVEDISYYRATAVFPELAGGREAPPFLTLGDEHAYAASGGKRAFAYTLDPAEYRSQLFGAVYICADLDLGAGTARSAGLEKGLALEIGTRELMGEGVGFGVPVVRYPDGWYYSGAAETVDLSGRDTVVWRKTFELDRVERYDAVSGSKSYRTVPSRGRIEITYTVEGSSIRIHARPLDLTPGFEQVGLLNEQSAAFDDFADPTRTLVGSDFPHWLPVSGDWARLRSARLGLEWSQPVLPGASLQAGRELQPPLLDWAGLDYLFGADFGGADYTVKVGPAR